MRCGVENSYPRYHVDVVDPETGIRHEWQIGTKATTRFFEEPGIEVGKVKIRPENRNIHDIEYDIFKAIEEPDTTHSPAEQASLKQLAKKVGIPEFRKKVATFAARTGSEDIPPAEFEATLKAMHKEASEILQRLVALRSSEFVESFIH